MSHLQQQAVGSILNRVNRQNQPFIPIAKNIQELAQFFDAVWIDTNHHNAINCPGFPLAFVDWAFLVEDMYLAIRDSSDIIDNKAEDQAPGKKRGRIGKAVDDVRNMPSQQVQLMSWEALFETRDAQVNAMRLLRRSQNDLEIDYYPDFMSRWDATLRYFQRSKALIVQIATPSAMQRAVARPVYELNKRKQINNSNMTRGGGGRPQANPRRRAQRSHAAQQFQPVAQHLAPTAQPQHFTPTAQHFAPTAQPTAQYLAPTAFESAVQNCTIVALGPHDLAVAADNNAVATPNPRNFTRAAQYGTIVTPGPSDLAIAAYNNAVITPSPRNFASGAHNDVVATPNPRNPFPSAANNNTLLAPNDQSAVDAYNEILRTPLDQFIDAAYRDFCTTPHDQLAAAANNDFPSPPESQLATGVQGFDPLQSQQGPSYIYSSLQPSALPQAPQPSGDVSVPTMAAMESMRALEPTPNMPGQHQQDHFWGS
ncbi:hypothetical protein B0T21DRAFT_345872 [Apiosordaria backusii]|uniref:Uncharacterized protein n=1 Tax=Apiosordaria backusii TaxID=314023 RepID=A0AA40K150_9PEZI|nr:hypothetical protein B0T21DRAFT_345872 [Apiosordaria backusii]